jgi:hypothetical protein
MEIVEVKEIAWVPVPIGIDSLSLLHLGPLTRDESLATSKSR